MGDVLGVIWLIGLTTVLPLLSVWFSTRKKINETNKRQEILMAMLEKNPDMDVEEWLGKLSPKKTLLKEKLLTKHLLGIICLVAGPGIILLGIIIWIFGIEGYDPAAMYFLGSMAFAAGIAFIVNYRVGKKLLAKEIEAEEKQETQEQA